MPSDFIGAGLRPAHYSSLEENAPVSPTWFEAISENYMDTHGRPLEMLLKVRARFPLALHGVSLSVGSVDPVNKNYLERLKRLVEIAEPFLVSDHLCWTGAHGRNLHDLLPIPFTMAEAIRVSEKIETVQNFLGRAISVENVSAYFRYRESDMTEWEFVSEVCRRSGCKLLLDINNVYVNSRNHGFDASEYLFAIDPEIVSQLHLAGFTDMGDFLFDTHSRPVSEEVWSLYSSFIARKKDVPVLIEWDEDIPEFSRLEKEVDRARRVRAEALKPRLVK